MLKKQTILIVEDEPSLLNALREKCSTEGFHVVTAQDGEVGLQAALREHPDLILLDIVMPKMDGITMAKKLRADTWGATAKIIMLTNLGTHEKLDDVIQQKVFDYLVKSDWTMEDLIAKIRERLNAK